MTITYKSIGLCMIAGTLLLAQDASISAGRMREYTKFLSSDLLEGRGVGQRGGDLATEYIANQFALAGAKPAGDAGTYFQKVPLVGLDLQRSSQLSAAANGRSVDFRWGDDWAGAANPQPPRALASQIPTPNSRLQSPQPDRLRGDSRGTLKPCSP